MTKSNKSKTNQFLALNPHNLRGIHRLAPNLEN